MSPAQVSQKAKLLFTAVFVFLVVVIDQVTKLIAYRSLRGTGGYSYLGGTFRIEYAENTGAFLSLGADMPDAARTAFFVVGVLIIIGFCVFWLWKSAQNWFAIVALAAVISGGIGNLIDRVSRGSVIDFLWMGIGPLRTGVFNVADIAISGGLVLMLLEQYVFERRRAKADPGAAPRAES